MSAYYPWPPICPHCGKDMLLCRTDARGFCQSALLVYECGRCQVWYTCGEPETEDEGAVLAAQMSVRPRRLRRKDWSALSMELRSYFTNLVKDSEHGSEAMFDHVISILERNSAVG